MTARKRGPTTTLELPASGLAEDLLGGASPAPGAPDAPDRLYAFADDVEREQQGTRSPAVEQRIETWVTFTLGGESFGLPVTHVQEILRVGTITRVPHAPAPVRGVTNLRGRVLPVVDLRIRLGLAPVPVEAASRVLVVLSRGRQLGLLVDSVQQVARLDRNKVQPPPPDVMTASSDYFLGVCTLAGSLVILLDVDRVLLIREKACLERANERSEP